MKKTIILLTAIIIATTTIGGLALYDKAHKVRTCKVIQNYDKCITVLHPNGERYDFYAEKSKEFKEGSYIRCSFNELKLDKENYEVRLANPKKVLIDIENK